MGMGGSLNGGNNILNWDRNAAWYNNGTPTNTSSVAAPSNTSNASSMGGKGFTGNVPIQSNPYSNYTAGAPTAPAPTTSQPVAGEAFGSSMGSNSDIASIIAGLVSSGVFNQQPGNPYAAPQTVPPSGLPYGQQNNTMFTNQNMAASNQGGYGGYQSQNWNPYGNYYNAGPASPNNMPQSDTSDMLKKLSLATQSQQNNRNI
jgi:hypothetical protein